MYGDPVNYRQWIFEEDLSVESLDLAARTQCEQAFARGRASKALPRRSATLDILPTEGRAPDIYVHHAATDIHRTDSREKNMLPTHATPKATPSDNDAGMFLLTGHKSYMYSWYAKMSATPSIQTQSLKVYRLSAPRLVVSEQCEAPKYHPLHHLVTRISVVRILDLFTDKLATDILHSERPFRRRN